MAQDRPATPEKQLLKLIEDPQAKSAPRIEAQAIKYHSQSFLSAGAWMGRFSFLKEKARGWMSVGSGHIDAVQSINIFLLVAIAGLAVYFVSSVSAALARQRSLKPVTVTVQQATAAAASATALSRLQDATYYLERISNRNIFKIGASKRAQEGNPEAVSKIEELTKGLRLVGISWSEDPDAMVEDTKLNRTFFVKKGQMVGELLVKEITKDKVLMSYQGEEAEIR